MKDRQPTQPGRVKITPENGDAFFAVMEMADEPLDMGTPPIKENLLRDETETALFGSARDRTVNDAFFGIASKLKLISADMASITLTVKSASGNPLSGVIINGAYDENGTALITGSDGTATGYVSEGSVTLSVSGYADIVDYSETFTAAKGQSYTKTITLTTRNFLKITSSKSVKFSANVKTVDVTVVGGGGAAGTSCANGRSPSVAATGGSGAGGYCIVQDNITITPNTPCPAVIGSGGTTTSSDGNDGGKSSFLGVEAAGGKGGKAATYSAAGAGQAGNGNGVYGRIVDQYSTGDHSGNDGNPGTVDGYDSFTTTTRFGGSGGSGGASNSSSTSGGNPGGYGGKGGGVKNPIGFSGDAGKDGFGGGGGSGGAFFPAYDGGDSADVGNPGKGGTGCVTMRIHFDFGDLTA